jgi:hypothetical protein
MAPANSDTESRILAAIQTTENRIMARVDKIDATQTKMQEALVRLEERVGGFEGQCMLRHKGVDTEIATIRANVRELRSDAENTGKIEVAELKAEIARRDAEKRKWLFWGITMALGLMFGGGGIAAGLFKLFSKVSQP